MSNLENDEVLVSAVEGNRQRLDGGAMFGNAPRMVWQKWIAPDEQGRIPLACRALLIETQNVKILCETGIGAFFEPKLADRFGVQDSNRHVLIENLEALGVKDSEINYVILSHLHFDHAGGLLPTYEQLSKGQSQLMFPNATYLVSREAWERALNPHPRDRASFIPELTEKLQQSGRLQIMDGSNTPANLKSRLSFHYSNGHTPGQMHTVFRGNQYTIVYAGDLIPGTPWVHLPITMGYDRYPEMLIDEKTTLYEKVVPRHWLVFYTHDPKYAASFIKKNEEQNRFEPELPCEQLVRISL